MVQSAAPPAVGTTSHTVFQQGVGVVGQSTPAREGLWPHRHQDGHVQEKSLLTADGVMWAKLLHESFTVTQYKAYT